MNELLAPPPLETSVVEVLSVDPWWVGTRFEDHVEGSVRVSATGGGRPVDRVVVAMSLLVECWHPNSVEARRIAATAWARLNAAAGSVVAGTDIKYVAPTLLVNNPDTSRPQLSRYQFLTTIHSRLVPLEV